MGRGPLAVFAAVLLVTGVAALAYMTRSREAIVSTPSAYTGLTTPLTLPPNGQACADEILYDTNGRIARFGATTRPGATAPDLEVTAQSYPRTSAYTSPYRFAARVPGGWTGAKTLDVPIRPPAKQTFGTFCVRNLSDAPFDLVGSQDGRAYSRPSITIDGQPSPLELQLRFMQAGRHSLLSRVGEMTGHAAVFVPFGAWWMWLLA